MDTPEPPDDESRLKPWQVVVGGAIVVAVFLIPYFVVRAGNTGVSEYGALLQGVAGAVALLFLLITLHLQRQDLELTRKEMKENTKEQKGQREAMLAQLEEQKGHRIAMLAQLEEMKRQNDFMREEALLRIRPIMDSRWATLPQFNLDVLNRGFGKSMVWRVGIGRTGGEDFNENIEEVLTSLWERHQLKHFLPRPIYAPRLTPKTLEINDGMNVFDMQLPPQLNRREEDALYRALLAELSQLSIRVEFTDIRNEQRQALLVDLRPQVEKIKLPVR